MSTHSTSPTVCHRHFGNNGEMIPDCLLSPARTALATATFAATAFIQFSTPPDALALGYTPSMANGDPPRLARCDPNTNCVSSGYLEPPNRYMSPLQTLSDRDTAYRRAVRDLSAGFDGKVETTAKDYYVHVEVPGTAPGSTDDIEILFGEESGIVNIRCEARITLPPPPFCVKKDCINGNMDQRERVQKVARILGLPAADAGRMKETAKWTPIFFNSDRVPTDLDYDDY